ncbi:MAG: Xaa-Pro peptidase family protein [Planctomycetota bacterium]
MIRPELKATDLKARREKVLRSLKGAAAVVFAGDASGHLEGSWRPNTDFEYLTGIADEPGAAVVFDPSAPTPGQRIALVLRPLDPEIERWDGLREGISMALREQTGFSTIVRKQRLPMLLTNAARRTTRLACMHQLSHYDQPVSPDLAAFKLIAERVPGVSIEDRSTLLAEFRSVKSRAEQKLIGRAVAATHSGLTELAASLEPGVTERVLQAALEHGVARGGGDGNSFNPIVASGLSATVLHYKTNDGIAQDGELLLVDSGTAVGGYASDITRTFPISGKFSKRQRELYELVLKALKASVRATKAGTTLGAVDAAARKVISDAGYADAFFHSIGHQLGLDVHDRAPDGPLKAGMVLTIEPGVYLPDERIGIRLEEDVVVTEAGCRNLSKQIPIEPEDVERFIRDAKKNR